LKEKTRKRKDRKGLLNKWKRDKNRQIRCVRCKYWPVAGKEKKKYYFRGVGGVLVED
jgi:hypothetical protein